MATYVILSKISPDAFQDPKEFRKIASEVASRIRKQCPGVTWKQSFATLGRFDVVDIVESRDPEQVARAARSSAVTALGGNNRHLTPQWQRRQGGLMLRDPVCGMDIDEINVPESLQTEWDERSYYFCSPECKLEFEKTPRKFIFTSEGSIEDIGAA